MGSEKNEIKEVTILGADGEMDGGGAGRGSRQRKVWRRSQEAAPSAAVKADNRKAELKREGP